MKLQFLLVLGLTMLVSVLGGGKWYDASPKKCRNQCYEDCKDCCEESREVKYESKCKKRCDEHDSCHSDDESSSSSMEWHCTNKGWHHKNGKCCEWKYCETDGGHEKWQKIGCDDEDHCESSSSESSTESSTESSSSSDDWSCTYKGWGLYKDKCCERKKCKRDGEVKWVELDCDDDHCDSSSSSSSSSSEDDCDHEKEACKEDAEYCEHKDCDRDCLKHYAKESCGDYADCVDYKGWYYFADKYCED